jgi:hypothetical protein
MAKPRQPGPVKLFCGLLGGDPDLVRRARQLLTRRYGPIDLETAPRPFDQTDYYGPEMGPDLQRCFLSFEKLVRPETLAEIKRDTNALEQEIADAALLPAITRPINVDPGYLNLAKVVLATTKDRQQRIYLSQGIYAETTLQFTQGRWQPWPWTYPDYRLDEHLEFFQTMRRRYHEQCREIERTLDASGRSGA